LIPLGPKPCAALIGLAQPPGRVIFQGRAAARAGEAVLRVIGKALSAVSRQIAPRLVRHARRANGCRLVEAVDQRRDVEIEMIGPPWPIAVSIVSWQIMICPMRPLK